jgi:hypothetical protein
MAVTSGGRNGHAPSHPGFIDPEPASLGGFSGTRTRSCAASAVWPKKVGGYEGPSRDGVTLPGSALDGSNVHLTRESVKCIKRSTTISFVTSL